jgi:hypothetical protein
MYFYRQRWNSFNLVIWKVSVRNMRFFNIPPVFHTCRKLQKLGMNFLPDMSRLGIEPGPPWWEASTLAKIYPNSVLITIRNIYI